MPKLAARLPALSYPSHGVHRALWVSATLVVAGCSVVAPPELPSPQPPATPTAASLPANTAEQPRPEEPGVLQPTAEVTEDVYADVPEPVATVGPARVYAPVGLVKIHDQPDRDAPVIGAMRAGQSVVLKDTTLTSLRKRRRLFQCDEGWYPVEPRGFVCVGGSNHATLDGNDSRVIAAAAVLPDLSADYPFKFGVSVGAPQYLRIPTAEEQRQTETDLDQHLANLPTDDDAQGGAIDTTPAGRPPSDAFLKYQAHNELDLVHKQRAYLGYKISWSQEFDANGRTWLMTPDMTLVPKDKVRQKPLPTLTGIDLIKNPHIELPLVFFWLNDSFKYVRGDDGKLVATDDKWKRHEFVETTMNQERGPGGIYWETKDGHFVKYQDVTLIRAAKGRPAGVAPHGKWVESRVTWGYLIAYEGKKPVYVAAMSPGVDGINNAKHATALGKHHVDWKMFSGDMDGRDKGKDWFVDEVPWVQYYKGNYALHGAWWHNDFGRPKSHGCINLAPADARHLFQWMDPVIPAGWYAVSTYYPHTTGTMVYIRH